MNFRGSTDWRDRRNLLNQSIPIGPFQYTIANYSTDCRIDRKIEMRSPFFDEEIFNRFRFIPDPLKKNLADCVPPNVGKAEINTEMPLKPQHFYYETDIAMENINNTHRNTYPSLTGITNFFSNFFGAISGAMFHKRAKSPVSQNKDCFEDSEVRPEMAPVWQQSNLDQNKIRAPDSTSTVSNDIMNDCRAAIAHCESKLDVVRSLLSNKTVPPPKLKLRRPKKVFVDPASIEDHFEDALSPEDYVSFSDEEYIEYYTIPSAQTTEFCHAEAPRTKTEMGPESTEIVNVLSAISEPQVSTEIPNKQSLHEMKEAIMTNDNTGSLLPEHVQMNCNHVTDIPEIIASNNEPKLDTKPELISSCEDKMAKLKSLLGNRKKISKITNTIVEPLPEKMVKDKPPKNPNRSAKTEKMHDKRFKNPHRLSCTKRKNSKIRKSIHEDMVFANEIDNQDLMSDQSPECSPVSELLPHSNQITPRASNAIPVKTRFNERRGCFDELKGRFYPSSTDSDDSFQIVFTDSPKVSRMPHESDCESEDSFIVFDDSPDSCYTSNDVFGENPISDDSGSELSDSESDFSDSGGDFKISQSLSRTISDLTDDSLYDDLQKVKIDGDVVDCAPRKGFEEIPDIHDIHESFSEPQVSMKVTECNSSIGAEVECTNSMTENCKVVSKPGMMLDEAKKQQRKELPPKKVSFSAAPPSVRVMRVWAYAARKAREGGWETHARDRERFNRRIADVDMAVSWVLKPQHRSRVMFQRFMPWWNAQRRKEAAERKAEEERRKMEENERQRQEEEKRKIEEEARKTEEERKRDRDIELGKSKAEEFLQPLREKILAKKLETEKRKKENRLKCERDATIEQRMRMRQFSGGGLELNDDAKNRLEINCVNDKITESDAELRG